MADKVIKKKDYYIKRTHKKTGNIDHIGPSDLSIIEERLKEYQSGEHDEYEYALLEFVYMPMPKD